MRGVCRTAFAIAATAVATALAAAATLAAQQPVLLGDSAAARFVYRGAPINPACVARLVYGEPALLSTCAADSGAGGDYGIRYFKVLANRGSDFLVASHTRHVDATSGSNGVAWISVSGDRLAYLRGTSLEIPEAGGSAFMCGGTGAYVDGRVVRVSKGGSTPDVLKLAGVYIDSASTRRLRESIRPGEAAGCDYADFTYDVSADRMTFDGVRLSGRALEMLDTVGARIPGANPQGCFDVLAWELWRAGRNTLSLAALADLGRTFAGRCLSPRAGEPPVTWERRNSPQVRGVPDSAFTPARNHEDRTGVSLSTVSGVIASVRVTWADSALFHNDSLIVGAFVRDLLHRPLELLSTVIHTSQGLLSPDMAAEVLHVGGAQGRLRVWSRGPRQWYLVYQDGNGRWWFGCQGAC